MAERIRSLILGVLDIRKLNKSCNFPSCNGGVDNEVLIYEYTTQRKKGLATLYLCGRHISVVKDIIQRIKASVPDKIIQSSIGKVAQNKT